MKECTHCNKSFDDRFDFCTSCGAKLEEKTTEKAGSAAKAVSKRWLVMGLSVLVGISLIIAYIVAENKRFSDAQQAIEAQKVQQYIDERISKVNTWDLRIERDWTSEKKGDYIYIRGSVKNVGDQAISYFKLSANFLDDDGNIIDSDWTNDGDLLKPDESRKFEIMHKFDDDIEDIQLEVSEVS